METTTALSLTAPCGAAWMAAFMAVPPRSEATLWDLGGAGTVFRFSPVAPRITSAAAVRGTSTFTWNAMPGGDQAQYKDALNQSTWNNLGLPVQGTNGLAGQSAAIGATNKARFYRVYFQF